MNIKNIIYSLTLLTMTGFVCASCSEWGDHFDEEKIGSLSVESYDGDIVSYMKNTAVVSSMSGLFEKSGIYDSVFVDKNYTFIVCNNDIYNAGISSVSNQKTFAENSVSDISVSPSSLTAGFGIHTRSGKNVWVYTPTGSVKLDDYNITKTVKTNNGYVYYVDGVIPVRLSVYEYLKTLGTDYSKFKQLVANYEETYFDKEHSAVKGVDDAGNTVYDTVWTTRNTLMDRFTSSGLDYWNMRNESFVSTMFIPTNVQIDKAVSSAMDSIPVWLNREATSADRVKFEKWIVRACFSNQRLEPTSVTKDASNFACVGGYQKIIDTQKDETKYESIEPAYWSPKVQTVDINKKVNLSNGAAYYCTNLKIPNHVVIYRVKSRFYELWNNMTDAQKGKYFRWNHWTEPMVINDCQGEFTLSATLPTIYYHELTAIPDSEAIADSLHCSVNYDGLVYNQTNNKIYECNLPAGEYYLRMGFKHSLTYSLSIYFNDSLLVKDMVMYAQGSNYHFDRGAASEIPHYASGAIAYPEGFNPDDWMELNAKAIAYDTDGYTVGIVNLKHSGNFTIKIDSYDDSYLYQNTGRNKNNVTQLMMYHWCLRPTVNNY
jgi:hypothetical protein